jgi:pimeloyl-ACP methyl ester carboxylesterase
VATPPLVLHGTADPEVPVREIERLREALPDARLVQVPGAGSMLPLTHGDLVAEEIARWIRLVGLPPSGQPAVSGGAPSAVTLSARGR